MFIDPTYSQVGDDFFKNEGYNKETIEKVSVISICGFLNMDDNGPFSYDNVNIDEAHGSPTPMEWALSWLWNIMAKITSQCKELASVQLCDHATSCLQIVALEIQALYMTQANESMHLSMVFNWVEDGLGNSVNHLKV